MITSTGTVSPAPAAGVVGGTGRCGKGCVLMSTIIRSRSDNYTSVIHIRCDRTPTVRWSRFTGTLERGHRGFPSAAEFIDKGLIGFDVGTGSDIVRPELLRLVNRGTQTTAEKQQSFALAA